MIHYSSSFRDFLYKSDSRIAKILSKIDARWEDYEQLYNGLITTDQIDYITFRSDGTISFLPAGKEHKQNDNGDWSREGRQNGRPGKVIKKLFKERLLRRISEKEFEIFANQYKAEYNGEDYEFALMENKKIPSVYNMSRINAGTLGNSCMNGDSSYLGIYKCCPKLKILILKDKEGLLCARALVWFLEDDFILMDRIYTCKEFMYDMFLDYAKKNKWNWKEDYKSFDNKTDFIRPNGARFSKNITVYTDTNFEAYPYIDTFSYGGDGYLCNYPDGDYEYDCTHGSRSGDPSNEDDHEGEVYDERNDEWISEEDAVRIDRGRRSGQYTHRDNTVCDVHGNYWMEDGHDLVYVESEQEYYPSDEVCYVEQHSEYYPSEDCVWSEHGDEDLLKSEATEIDGKWYRDEDVVWSERDSEDYIKEDCVETDDSWILKDDAVEIDGKWVHKDDVPPPRKEEEIQAENY